MFYLCLLSPLAPPNHTVVLKIRIGEKPFALDRVEPLDVINASFKNEVGDLKHIRFVFFADVVPLMIF